MTKAVVASFDGFHEAREVVRDLHQRGFPADDISLIANERSVSSAPDGFGEDVPAATRDTLSPSTRAATGGVIGAGLGVMAGLAGLAIPGVGPIVAAGPLAAALAGAGVGAVAGGLIGGLVGLGVPEEHAHHYAEAVRRGGVLVTVTAADARAEEAAEVMRSHGAVDIARRAAQWRESGWTGHDPAGEPYTDDEFERERAAYRDTSGRPLHAAGSDADATIGSATMGGRPLSGNLGSGPGVPDMTEWNEHRSSFRAHHADTYRTSRYEDYEPAYQYGWESARSERHRGRSWSAVEPELRRDWERRYPEGGAWGRFKDAVRNGWERASNAVEHAVPGDSDRDGR